VNRVPLDYANPDDIRTSSATAKASFAVAIFAGWIGGFTSVHVTWSDAAFWIVRFFPVCLAFSLAVVALYRIHTRKIKQRGAGYAVAAIFISLFWSFQLLSFPTI
jgi:hypothetical protein